MQIQNLPILGICGTRNSAKSSLIQHTVRRLKGKGLKVEVFKDVGKGLEELSSLAIENDLVLVDGCEKTPVPHIRMVTGGVSEFELSNKYVLTQVNQSEDYSCFIDNFVDDFLVRQWLKPPVVGCILIGGNSTRMGCPKHLIKKDGITWIENTLDLMGKVTDHVVVVGKGEMPVNLVTRIDDIAGCYGPLSGVLAAYRLYPWSSLLVCACDMPDLTISALQWLLSQRSPGVWSVLPKNGKYYEPLLALYDLRMISFFEKMLDDRNYSLSAVASSKNAKIVEPPVGLRSAWHNVNYADQIVS